MNFFKSRMIVKLRYLSIALIITLMIAGDFAHAQNREVQFLSGTDNENTVTWEFFCTGGRKSGYWTTIDVPSHWEQQGFGNYDYGRNYRTYGKKFRFADESGIYRYQFEIPNDWKEKEVFIVFEGSMTDTEVKINGQLAGSIHQGSFYRFRYNISDKLNRNGKNELEVTVHKVSANRSVNAAERYADYWIFGGIFRPVYLEAYPEEHIERVAIDAKADGTFKMDVFPQNLKKEHKIIAEIIDSKGKAVKNISVTANPGDSIVRLSTKINDPDQWTPETPALYSIRVKLVNGNDEKYELSEKFGFRTIEIRKSDGIYVNGVKVKMKGINRHVWWPETGRCINPKIDLLDVQLIKEMNMNAVRCSHYPPNKSFLNICDSLGLFVLDELAGWQNAYDTEVGSKLVKEMVIRDLNHPSILFWSNGNEGGTNKDLDDDFGIYDLSNRPVIHAHHRPGNDFNGIDCNHYENYYSSKTILEDSLIFMPTEFLHGQDDGGAAASLADFWELFWNSKRGAGGFLWAMLDEGLVRTDINNLIDVNRLNAPDGVMGPHREKEGSFYAIREIYSPVKIRMKSLPEDFSGEIDVENRYHFTNLNQCNFRWELVSYHLPAERETGYVVNTSGEFTGPDVKPVAKGAIQIPLFEGWTKNDALVLKAFDPFGKEIYTWTWKIKGNQNPVNTIVKTEGNGVETSESDESVTMKANGISVEFSKTDGTIKSLGNDFSLPLLFSNGPVLVGGNSTFKNLRHFDENNNHVVEAMYEGDLKYIRWTMHGSGWLSLEYEYYIDGEVPFAGVTFDFPESNIISAKWLGNGPYRVWKNRLQGVSLNVYQNLYNDTQTGYSPWIYPEFKGYFSDVTWMEFDTSEGKFLMVAEELDLFVRLFEFYGITGPQNYPGLPSGDISFLDAIPPIGTKLATNISMDTKNLGPSGELFQMQKPVKRTLWFYFGFPEE